MGVFDSPLGDREDIIAGRYQVERLLGRGGMGDIYLVSDKVLGGEHVALKVLKAELCDDSAHTRRFLREVQLTRKLSHPNVVRTFDVGSENGRLFFTMEVVPGCTLKEYTKGQPCPWRDAVRILIDICHGLSAIHEATIVHRDLKLTNVMVTPEGVIKIADFGVARPGASTLTGSDELVGSATHMAPEIWQGTDVTHLADIYSLGVLTYELLTGVLPFDGETPADLMWKHLQTKATHPLEIFGEIPEWLDRLVMQMLEKRPLDRPSSAHEIATLLQRHLDNRESATHATGREVYNPNLEEPAPFFETSITPAGIEPSSLFNTTHANQMRPRSIGLAAVTKRRLIQFFSSMLFGTLVALSVVLGASAALELFSQRQSPFVATGVGVLVLLPLILSIPILVTTAMFRSPFTAVKIWFLGTLVMIPPSLSLAASNAYRLFELSYQIQGGDPGRILSSVLTATVLHAVPAGLLVPAPYGFRLTVIGETPTLTPSTAVPGIWAFQGLIFGIVIALFTLHLSRTAIRRSNGKISSYVYLLGASLLCLLLSVETLAQTSFPALTEMAEHVLVTFSILGVPVSLSEFQIAALLVNWGVLLLVTRLFRPDESTGA